MQKFETRLLHSNDYEGNEASQNNFHFINSCV